MGFYLPPSPTPPGEQVGSPLQPNLHGFYPWFRVGGHNTTLFLNLSTIHRQVPGGLWQPEKTLLEYYLSGSQPRAILSSRRYFWLSQLVGGGERGY